MAFKAGDMVMIVTPKEYRDRGGNCTDDCAIAYYAGSICEVIFAYPGGDEYTLSPVELMVDPHVSFRGEPLDYYHWQDRALKTYTETLVTGFDAVFDRW